MKTTTKPTARLVHSSPMTAERALPERCMGDDSEARPGERALGCGRSLRFAYTPGSGSGSGLGPGPEAWPGPGGQALAAPRHRFDRPRRGRGISPVRRPPA
eukprot:scaffold61688_cov36-Phaeocystis_antarctica.AAC.2